MTVKSSWWGTELGPDELDLQTMLDAFSQAHDLVLHDDTTTVANLVGELAALGVWTLGTAENAGGGGADRVTTSVVFERLGRSWPALGWASVQAHAAVDVLAGDERFTDLCTRVHEGSAAVAVVDEMSVHVRLGRDGDGLSGSIARVDAAHEHPYVVVLGTEDTALVIEPTAIDAEPLRRTGLGGAFTRALDIDAGAGGWHEIAGAEVASARSRLRWGAATVAAGLAAGAAHDALEYATERRQFGDALTAIPTVRQSILDQAAHSAVSLLAAHGADGELAVLAALRAACDTAIDVAAKALQSHGGYGYLTEYSAERRLRDAVSLRAAADSSGAALFTARSLVGLAPVASALRKDA